MACPTRDPRNLTRPPVVPLSFVKSARLLPPRSTNRPRLQRDVVSHPRTTHRATSRSPTSCAPASSTPAADSMSDSHRSCVASRSPAATRTQPSSTVSSPSCTPARSRRATRTNGSSLTNVRPRGSTAPHDHRYRVLGGYSRSAVLGIPAVATAPRLDPPGDKDPHLPGRRVRWSTTHPASRRASPATGRAPVTAQHRRGSAAQCWRSLATAAKAWTRTAHAAG